MTIAIPPTLERRIYQIARETGDDPADLVLRAIEEYVSDLEDLRIAEERIADLRAGRSSTVSLEELMNRYGLAD